MIRSMIRSMIGSGPRPCWQRGVKEVFLEGCGIRPNGGVESRKGKPASAQTRRGSGSRIYAPRPSWEESVRLVGAPLVRWPRTVHAFQYRGRFVRDVLLSSGPQEKRSTLPKRALKTLVLRVCSTHRVTGPRQSRACEAKASLTPCLRRPRRYSTHFKPVQGSIS